MCVAALNASLGAKLHSPALATTILFMVGGVVSLAYLFLSGGISKSPIQTLIPIFFYLGGLFVMLYILSITWVAPKSGVGDAVSFVLLGQLISMVVLDHFWIIGALQHSVTSQRFAGLALMIVGVFLTVRRF